METGHFDKTFRQVHPYKPRPAKPDLRIGIADPHKRILNEVPLFFITLHNGDKGTCFRILYERERIILLHVDDAGPQCLGISAWTFGVGFKVGIRCKEKNLLFL